MCVILETCGINQVAVLIHNLCHVQIV
jgi:hypothetical protein